MAAAESVIREAIERASREQADLDRRGGSACIGADAIIVGPTVIGANSVIEPGATIRECIIGEHVRVSAGARLERKIIHGSHCIDPGAGYLDLREWDLGWLIGDARARPVTNEPQGLLKHLTATAATRAKETT